MGEERQGGEEQQSQGEPRESKVPSAHRLPPARDGIGLDDNLRTTAYLRALSLMITVANLLSHLI